MKLGFYMSSTEGIQQEAKRQEGSKLINILCKDVAEKLGVTGWSCPRS